MSATIYNKQLQLEKYSWYKLVISLSNPGIIKIFESNNTVQLIPTIKFPNKLFINDKDEYIIYLRTLADSLINVYGLGTNIKELTVMKSSFSDAQAQINLQKFMALHDLEFTLYYMNIFGKVGATYNKLLDKFKLLKDEVYFNSLQDKIIVSKSIPKSKAIVNDTILVLLENTYQYENDMNAIYWHDILKLLHTNYDYKFIVVGKYGYPFDKNPKIYSKKVSYKIEDISYAKIYNTKNTKDIFQENMLTEYILKYSTNLIDFCDKNGIKLVFAYGYINGLAAYYAKIKTGIPFIYEPSNQDLLIINNLDTTLDNHMLFDKINKKIYEECTAAIVRVPVSGLNEKNIYIPYSINKNYVIDPKKKSFDKIKLGYIGFDTNDNIDNIINILKVLPKVNCSLTIILEENIVSKQLDNYKKQGNITISICSNYNDLPKLCKNVDAFIFGNNYNIYNLYNVMGLKKPIFCNSDIHRVIKYENLSELPTLIKNLSLVIDPNAFNYETIIHENVLDSYNKLFNL